jgi:hypothetical protein
MSNRWAGEFEREQRSPACESDSHRECPHGFARGGGFNPRRFRLEFGHVLCRCDCHQSCPLSGRRAAVSPALWRDCCVCPGAAATQARMAGLGIEVPDFRADLAERRRKSELRRAAASQVRASAAGRSREQVRQLYLAALAERGLPAPADRVLEISLDALTGHYGSSVRELGRAAGGMARSARDIARIFAATGEPPDSPAESR